MMKKKNCQDEPLPPKMILKKRCLKKQTKKTTKKQQKTRLSFSVPLRGEFLP